MSDNGAGVRLSQLPERENALSKEKHVVQSQIQLRLRKSGYHELHFVSCEFHAGVITLFLLRKSAGRFARGRTCIKKTHPYPYGNGNITHHNAKEHKDASEDGSRIVF
jgi:hypothetical protein